MRDFDSAKYAKDDFRPHVTLSYDAQANIRWEQIDIMSLCPEVANFEIVEEYQDQFDKNWDKKLY